MIPVESGHVSDTLPLTNNPGRVRPAATESKTMKRKINEVRISWDSQDASNEGWAYLATFDCGRQESGEVDSLVCDASLAELVAKAEEIAQIYGGSDGESNRLDDADGAVWTANS